MSTDVLISFDTTGSMSPCIAEVRMKVKDTLYKLFTAIPDLRVGIIAHGDYCDKYSTYVIKNVTFTKDLDALQHFISTVENTYGGDSDECYEYVLATANEYDWQADNRIFILIGDALPHDVGYSYYHNSTREKHTNYIYWTDEVSGLSSKRVNIYAVQALGSKYNAHFYETLAERTNGRKLDLNQFTDSVETIISICYHSTGRLEEYKQELESTFKMNRNLANVFKSLGLETVSEVFTKKDASGLIPVLPTRFQRVSVGKNTDIKSFVESIGATFRKGRGFYQFTKSEEVQERKEVILRNKLTGDMFTGNEARNFIGLPYGKRGVIRPHYFNDYEVYIQSTSSNRKLIKGTKFLYET